MSISKRLVGCIRVDWDVGLRDERGLVNQVGLYDMSRRPRRVAHAYHAIIQEFRETLAINLDGVRRARRMTLPEV